MSDTLTERTKLTLANGTENGAAVLDLLTKQDQDIGSTLATLAWVLAVFLHNAADQEAEDKVTAAFESSVNIYLQFFCDMEDPTKVAEIDEAAAAMLAEVAAEQKH